jgi:hypothetical protein
VLNRRAAQDAGEEEEDRFTRTNALSVVCVLFSICCSEMLLLLHLEQQQQNMT